MKDKFAIVGLGLTKQGRLPGTSANALAVEAIRLAAQDAGITNADIDGYVYQSGIGGFNGGDVPRQAGIHTKFIWSLQTGGVTGISCALSACAAIEAGIANYVVCVHSTTAATQQILVGGSSSEFASLNAVYGLFGPGPDHALAARRHMHEFGTTSMQLGAIAVQTREYANKRPDAFMHSRPMSIEDHQNSRIIADPLHMLDFCLVTDGAVAFIVTSAEKAKSLKRPPIYIMGMGLGHQVRTGYQKKQYTQLDVAPAKEAAFRSAGLELKDIDVAEIYDCFTITVLMELEGYGFCGKGEGGPFVEAGNLRLNGAIPTNTGGGNLSAFYLQGFTPIQEAIRQLRGDGGETQVKDAEIALVSGHGATGTGSLQYAHGSMILRR